MILVDETTHQVTFLGQTQPGRVHDKKLADDAELTFPAGTCLTQDTGFQGYAPPGAFVIQSKKRMRGQWLSACDHIANRLKASGRVLVEHTMAGIKRCHIVTAVLRRASLAVSDMVMTLACALHNLRTDFRYLRSRDFQLKLYFR